MEHLFAIQAMTFSLLLSFISLMFWASISFLLYKNLDIIGTFHCLKPVYATKKDTHMDVFFYIIF